MSRQQAQLELTPKQSEFWDYANDKVTREILFGGGAGGGKSLILCAFCISQCMKYVRIRAFIGRDSLEDFKKSTLLTLFDLFNRWNLKEGIDCYFNQQDKYFEFIKTESRLYYNELSYYPSDPEYSYLGSTEYTFGCIDEAQQVEKKAKNVLLTRIRYKVAENGLVPKLLMSCNPDKGHLYSDFYKPAKNGQLSEDKKFVQALAKDNRFIDKTYIHSLELLDDKNTKERLLFGNWEYDADPTRLMEIDAINDLFSNVVPLSEEKYITADIARLGGDKIVFGYWVGWCLKEIQYFEKLPLFASFDNPNQPNVYSKLTELRNKYGVSLSHIVVDEDGMGGGIKDRIGCKGFVNNSKALKNENYANLKSQCYYKFAKKVNLGEISINCENQQIKGWIIEELEQVKAKNADKDGRLMIVGKDEVKDRIGRSPDFSDMLMMRMIFDLSPKPQILFI